MPPIDDAEDADVPAQAVRALKAAQERARLAGHPLVMVRGRQLVRIENGVVTVLKELLPRKTVRIRTPRPES